jgi:uncharacterized protein YijF (DUF1287 family)
MCVARGAIGFLAGLVLSCVASHASAAASLERVVQGARGQIGVTTRYDPAYTRLSYPGGDVPRDRGVCTDVVIRAYRAVGVDLQQRVHDDMQTAWNAYPHVWGLKSTDTNIDHRRVQNLEVFFRRHGATVVNSQRASDYAPGDIVTWRLSNGLPHIGIVSRIDASGAYVIHNIGAGAQEEPVLFDYAIVGHFRYAYGGDGSGR